MSIGTFLLLWLVVSIVTAPLFGAFAGFNRLDKD